MMAPAIRSSVYAMAFIAVCLVVYADAKSPNPKLEHRQLLHKAPNATRNDEKPGGAGPGGNQTKNDPPSVKNETHAREIGLLPKDVRTEDDFLTIVTGKNVTNALSANDTIKDSNNNKNASSTANKTSGIPEQPAALHPTPDNVTSPTTTTRVMTTATTTTTSATTTTTTTTTTVTPKPIVVNLTEVVTKKIPHKPNTGNSTTADEDIENEVLNSTVAPTGDWYELLSTKFWKDRFHDYDYILSIVLPIAFGAACAFLLILGCFCYKICSKPRKPRWPNKFPQRKKFYDKNIETSADNKWMLLPASSSDEEV